MTQLTQLLSAVILSIMLPINTGFAQTLASEEIATDEDFPETDRSVSADGRFRVYGENDRLIVLDLWTNNERVIYTGNQINVLANAPIISDDGQVVLFTEEPIADQPSYLLRHDIQTGETKQLNSTVGTNILPSTAAPFFTSDSGAETRANDFSRGVGLITYGPRVMSGDGRYTVHGRDVYDAQVGSSFTIDTECNIPPNPINIVNGINVVNGVNFTNIVNGVDRLRGPQISSDGKIIAYYRFCIDPDTTLPIYGLSFSSVDSALQNDLMLYEISTGTNNLVAKGGGSAVIISENNRYLRFSNNVYDRLTGEIYIFGVSNDCVDIDGDGWGYREHSNASCLIQAPTPQMEQSGCDYSNAELYDGWGWNATTSESCAPLDSITVQQTTSQCVDSDGDGFGWDGTATCTVDAGTPVTSTVPDTNCNYSNAATSNGWGWNEATRDSCAPLTVTGEQVTPEPPAGCDYSNAAISNGWGWNETTRQSCAPL